MTKIRKKSPIHDNADENITYDFGDCDISRSSSRFTHTQGQPARRIASSIIVRLYQFMVIYTKQFNLFNLFMIRQESTENNADGNDEAAAEESDDTAKASDSEANYLGTDTDNASDREASSASVVDTEKSSDRETSNTLDKPSVSGRNESWCHGRVK